MACLRLATLLAFALAFLLRGASAEACTDPVHTMSRVVGFEADGRFVQHERYESEASEDGPRESFTLYDRTGEELSRLSLEWDEKRHYFWKATGSSYFGRLGKGLGVDDGARLEQGIRNAKKLTMPVKRRELRHVKSDADCGSIELKTGDGWLRVAEGDEWRDRYAECASFAVSGFEHPKVAFLFVEIHQRIGSGDSLEEVDVVTWLPRRDVEGIALAVRGERARLKGRNEEAIRALEASIRAVPEYLPSRVSLVRAYAKSKRTAAPALAALRHPIPKGTTLLGEFPDDEVLAKLLATWPGTRLPESLPWVGARTFSRSVATD